MRYGHAAVSIARNPNTAQDGILLCLRDLRHGSSKEHGLQRTTLNVVRTFISASAAAAAAASRRASSWAAEAFAAGSVGSTHGLTRVMRLTSWRSFRSWRRQQSRLQSQWVSCKRSGVPKKWLRLSYTCQ